MPHAVQLLILAQRRTAYSKRLYPRFLTAGCSNRAYVL